MGHADQDIARYFTDLQNKNGILFGSRNDVGSKFSDLAQDNLFEIEDISWWFQYRARVIERVEHRFLDKEKLLFDVGGGNGYTTCLQEFGYDVALIEPSFAACINAKNRGLRTVVCGTLAEDTVKDASIRQAAILDMLKHIECEKEKNV